MAKLKEFQKLVLDLACSVDFITVYTEEAHPTDGWAISINEYKIKQHTLLSERIAAAEMFAKQIADIPVPVLTDNMGNTASLKYASEPDRLYVIANGKVVYQGGKGPFGYKVDELREFLETNMTLHQGSGSTATRYSGL